MKTQKISILLKSSENKYSKFETRKWYIIDGESKGRYSHHNPIKFLTKPIESSLRDNSDAYILVTEYIDVTNANNANLASAAKNIFKSCAPFKNCTTNK